MYYVVGTAYKGIQNGLIWYVSLFVLGIGLGSGRRIRGLLGSFLFFPTLVWLGCIYIESPLWYNNNCILLRCYLFYFHHI